MVNLSQIESDLTIAMKAKDQLAVDVLRGLKTRVQNEQIAKLKELAETDIFTLIRSEIKKRNEAAEAFAKGGREAMAKKELKETAVLQKYLPAQMPEEELAKIVDAVIAEKQFAIKDFGKAMSLLKAKLGSSADGSILARLLKERLK